MSSWGQSTPVRRDSPWLDRSISFASVYNCAMDAVAGLLDGPRARGAFLLRSSMDPPWSLRIGDEAPLTLVAMVRGEAWLVPDDGEPGAARPRATWRSCAARTPTRWPTTRRTPPQVLILPGQVCRTPDGRELTGMTDLGVRAWGNSAEGATVMVTGTYQLGGEVSDRLLRALPPRLVIPDDAWGSPAHPAARRRGRARRARARRPCSTACSTCC